MTAYVDLQMALVHLRSARDNSPLAPWSDLAVRLQLCEERIRAALAQTPEGQRDIEWERRRLADV